MNRNRYAVAPRKFRGFTLVEVLLVIAIIGVLATVMVVTIGGQGENAKKKLADILVKKVAAKVEQYASDMGSYPTESEGGLNALMSRPTTGDELQTEKWAGPYISAEDTTDPWGSPLNYEGLQAGTESASGVRFKLWSNGPDKQSNTADDITFGVNPNAGV